MRKAIAFTAAGAIVLTGGVKALAATQPAANSASGAALTSASARVNNPWFPLKPGTIAVYAGVKDGLSAVDVFKVTHKTHVIAGVRCVVIDDRLHLAGRLAERTTDWYAQDKTGNVWYFGEATAELNPNGTIKSMARTFKPAATAPGRASLCRPTARRGDRPAEFSKGNAEDHFKILSLSARISAPGGSSRHALLTQETTPLEPGVLDHKTYVRNRDRPRSDDQRRRRATRTRVVQPRLRTADDPARARRHDAGARRRIGAGTCDPTSFRLAAETR